MTALSSRPETTPETMPETTAGTATHQVALSFEDGVTRFITVREDQTVADASYRQRINIPLDCRDGACGTCKARCESGEYDGGAYIDDALTQEEAADGLVLPCSMKPRSDLVLQIRSTSEVAKTRAATYTGTLVSLERLSPTTVQVAVEIPNRDELAFLPGQYVNIDVPGTDLARSYSFSNGPDDPRLTFLVKLTPGGAMSDYLDQRAAVGDVLTFTGPNGSFFLREAARPVLLVAGGTGLAPILAMLRRMHAEGSTRRAHLVYGVSTDDDVVGLDELARLATALPSLTWEYVVADPATRAPNQGYVTSLLRPEHLHEGEVAVYLCGPPPMVEAVRRHVAEAGIEPTGFYYEKFALAVPVGADVQQPPVATGERRDVSATGSRAELEPHPEARSVAGQVLLGPAELAPLSAGAATDPGDVVRRIAGQLLAPPVSPDAVGGVPETLQEGDDLLFVDGALGEPTAGAVTITPDGYQIGEEHPGVQESDAIFEARAALELGALELTIGRLATTQLTGYRLLAESTLPYVEDDHFTDAAAYTETNAAFHDYLFSLTGNEHLLHAYQALGVKGKMAEVLRNATWCHPLCAQDHVDIVDAFERGDRDTARTLVRDHAERSKQTMRRAMADEAAASRPRFVTPGRFAGKVVVVTGAAQGIGERTARRIAAEGGILVLADRSELVVGLADELRGTGTGDALAVTADLEQWSGAEQVVEAALARFGRIDVLVNNVGGAINFKPFTTFTEAEIRAEIDRSLMTTLYACRAALPSMVERRDGVVVNVSSAATRGVHRIPYSAAKGGVNALTASLALEYAEHGIRVVATAPGGTEAPPRRISRGTPAPSTETEAGWFQAHVDQTLASSLLHRYGTLDEQAAAICFLASDEASYITGTVLPVAGGDLG